ncbi:MAG TPA: hypothetical protein VMU04_22905 [Candidatus Acidoferrum sp.]|nr:hypothetical protein [Candidatus Acidoferrum sp.]
MVHKPRTPSLYSDRVVSPLAVPLMLVALGGACGSAATLTVTNTNPSGLGSLQQAILDANATNGLDTIVFQIPGSGVHTISPTNILPAITDSVNIDGTTQPGYAGTPLIEINGVNAGSTSDGFRLQAGTNMIVGLVINNFGGAGIHIQAPSASNVIQANFIGTDATGLLSRGNGLTTPRHSGVWLDGSGDNLVGGIYSSNANVISGNGDSGVYLLNCSGNTVQGNLIGTTLSGTTAIGNRTNGIGLYNAGTNQIGGTSAGAGNVTSGNGWNGINLYGANSSGNQIQGNYVGTTHSGTTALPNIAAGINLNAAPANLIGGTDPGAGNLVSGNGQGGISLLGPGANGNLIQGNLVGTDASGRLPLGNAYSGVTVLVGNSNLVGGTSAAARNIISANNQAGVYLSTNSMCNLVQGNYIGVDATGGSVLANAINGISIDSASSNTIGGASPGARNIISGNKNYGIEVFNATATSNTFQGNFIGTDVTGLTALANKYWGIYIQSPGNTVGGTGSGAGNLVSGNGQGGVFLSGALATNNMVQGNLIGTTASGTAALGNGGAGVGITSAAGNLVGGTAPGAGNVLSANGDAGVFLYLSGTTGNHVQGNTIGADITGNSALPNVYEGVYAERGSTNLIGGTAPGAGNLISGNGTRGIWFTNSSWNVVQGNLIGTKRDGATGLGNTDHSVECEVGACNNLIGGAGSAGNTIAWAQSGFAGVRIRDGSTNNAILGNSIFSNGALGIDLGTAGPNPNVSCGTGTGANMAENYPVLSQAVSGSGTGIRGVLNSRANASFVLQFFANPVCDSSGYGEGQIYLGQKTVATGTHCTNSFVADLPVEVPVGYVITATATDVANNTSEFCQCVPVTPVPALGITALSGNQQVALAWTNTATGFVLKQTPSLSPPIQWTTVTNAPGISNGHFIVTLATVTGGRFYVLSFE